MLAGAVYTFRGQICVAKISLRTDRVDEMNESRMGLSLTVTKVRSYLGLKHRVQKFRMKESAVLVKDSLLLRVAAPPPCWMRNRETLGELL